MQAMKAMTMMASLPAPRFLKVKLDEMKKEDPKANEDLMPGPMALGKGQLRVTKVPASASSGGQERARIMFIVSAGTREKVLINGSPFRGMNVESASKPGKGGKTRETVSLQMLVSQEGQTKIHSYIFRVKDKDASDKAMKALNAAATRC